MSVADKLIQIINELAALETEAGCELDEIAISQPLFYRFQAEMEKKRIMSYGGDVPDRERGLSVLRLRTSFGEVTIKPKRPEHHVHVDLPDRRHRHSKPLAPPKPKPDTSFVDELARL